MSDARVEFNGEVTHDQKVPLVVFAVRYFHSDIRTCRFYTNVL